MARITFSESSGGYQQRTRENAAAADVTVAVMADPDTYGERATRKAAGQRYVPIDITSADLADPLATGRQDGRDLATVLSKMFPRGVTEGLALNIAGNGIYTLEKAGISQHQLDLYCTALVHALGEAGVQVRGIRSGGQTGVDEAGLAAGLACGIDVVAHAPKGWTFRDAAGVDHADQLAFRGRFTKERIAGLRDSLAQENLLTAAPVRHEERIVKSQKQWSRQDVAEDTRSLYVFTDNTDRDSGKNLVPDDSEYARRFGKGHHYPSTTLAVARGLDNAVPVSTQRWYHEGAKGEAGRWKDENLEEFKEVIREEFAEIRRKWNSRLYDRIVFPSGGLFDGKISAITEARTPKLYKTLKEEVEGLRRYVSEGFGWARGPVDRSDDWDAYELSTKGDRRYSALVATFAAGTKVGPVDVGGMTVEDAYQMVLKRSGKGQPPAADSPLYQDSGTQASREERSYRDGYLPLWTIWAQQNPALMDGLRNVREHGPSTLYFSDSFATTGVSQARALCDILDGNALPFPRYVLESLSSSREKTVVPPAKAEPELPFGGLSREPAKDDVRKPARVPSRRPSAPRFSGLSQRTGSYEALSEASRETVEGLVSGDCVHVLRDTGRVSVHGMVNCRLLGMSLEDPGQVFASFDLALRETDKGSTEVVVLAPGTDICVGNLHRFIDREGRFALQSMRNEIDRVRIRQEAPSQGEDIAVQKKL